MEGNCLSETSPTADVCCGRELNRSNSDSSTLTAEICEDILHQSPEDSKMWTNEKHSLYLENLEVSFVKQLHQSIDFLAQCTNRSKRPINASSVYRSKRTGVVKEGTGQNFADEDDETNSDTKLRVKRLKT